MDFGERLIQLGAKQRYVSGHRFRHLFCTAPSSRNLPRYLGLLVITTQTLVPFKILFRHSCMLFDHPIIEAFLVAVKRLCIEISLVFRLSPCLPNGRACRLPGSPPGTLERAVNAYPEGILILLPRERSSRTWTRQSNVFWPSPCPRDSTSSRAARRSMVHLHSPPSSVSSIVRPLAILVTGGACCYRPGEAA